MNNSLKFLLSLCFLVAHKAIFTAQPGGNTWQHKSHATYFYDKKAPFYAFTNFFHLKPARGHTLSIDNKIWRSSEHYFQAQKFIYHPALFNKILSADSAHEAFLIAQQQQKYIRSDWYTRDINGLAPRDKVMIKVLWEKFTQNNDLKQLLLATGTQTLIEDSPNDEYWGRGKSWDGQNQLGQMLMYIRWLFTNGYNPSPSHPFTPFGPTHYR